MAETRLSIRSARACELARRLARRESPTVANVVERALEAYEAAQSGQESAAEFYARLGWDCATAINLDALLREHRQATSGPEL